MRLLFANLHVACGVQKPQSALPAATFRENLQLAAELFLKSGAEAIALCEVDFSSWRSAYIDQAQVLAQLTGFKAFPLETYTCPQNAPGVPALFADCRYGLCWLIAPRLEIKPLAPLWLPNPPEEGASVSEQRALFALSLIRNEGPPLWLGLTHLDHRQRATRHAQLATIGNALPSSPWILAGDFNEPLCHAETPDTGRLAALAQAHDWPLPADGAWPARFLEQSANAPKALWPSYPLPSPQAAIDHVFAGGGAHITALRSLDSAGISDHLWLLADIDG